MEATITTPATSIVIITTGKPMEALALTGIWQTEALASTFEHLLGGLGSL